MVLAALLGIPLAVITPLLGVGVVHPPSFLVLTLSLFSFRPQKDLLVAPLRVHPRLLAGLLRVLPYDECVSPLAPQLLFIHALTLVGFPFEQRKDLLLKKVFGVHPPTLPLLCKSHSLLDSPRMFFGAYTQDFLPLSDGTRFVHLRGALWVQQATQMLLQHMPLLLQPMLLLLRLVGALHVFALQRFCAQQASCVALFVKHTYTLLCLTLALVFKVYGVGVPLEAFARHGERATPHGVDDARGWSVEGNAG